MTLAAQTDPRPRPGRPLRLTQEVHDAIVEAVEQGSYIKVAAQAAGVGQSTLAAWLARGRQAAQAVTDHDDGGLYCPDCDLVRTSEVLQVQEEQRRLDTERAERIAALPPGVDGSDEPWTGTVLNRCPRCGSREDPHEWTLPDEEAPFLELLESVTLAQAKAETSAVAAWRRAFTGHEPDWRAARDYLARVAPERWAGVTRVQMTGEEAERRIEDAVNETLLAFGIDMHGEQIDDDLSDPDGEGES